MSKIHPKLKALVIGKGNEPPNIKALKELREQFEEVCKNLDESDYMELPSSYSYTARPYVFPILEKDLVPMIRGKDDKAYIPSYMVRNKKLLKDAYNAGTIDGKVYSEDHPDVVRAVDTNNLILKKDAIEVLNRSYCELEESLVSLENYDRPAYKGDIVTTEDTKETGLKTKFYKYKDGKTTKYYKYASLAPDAPKKRVYFEEAQFPTSKEINETRVGIELEYSEAVEASRKALCNENYRNRWLSIRDGSIPKEGTEFVSIPFKKTEFNQIENFINFCESHGVRISKQCGFHVHVGSPDMDFKSLTSIVLFCQNIQEDLFKLVPEHRQQNKYCKKLDKSWRGFKKAKTNKDAKEVADIFYEDAGSSYEKRHQQSKYACNNKRHYWISIDRFFRFKEETHKRTVEFRMHHATHDAEEFMQFVTLCYWIVEFGIRTSISKARNADLREFMDWIPDSFDQKRVEELLTTKKVLEYVS